jgi:hypothetical protein
MSDPAERVCTECGEESERLHRRFWFRSWWEGLASGEPMAEVHYVCDACRTSERRKSLLYLCIVVVAIAIVAVVLLAEIRKW